MTIILCIIGAATLTIWIFHLIPSTILKRIVAAASDMDRKNISCKIFTEYQIFLVKEAAMKRQLIMILPYGPS